MSKDVKMSDKNDVDLGKIVDSFFKTAKTVTDKVSQKSGEFVKESGLQDLKDFYPFYSWPPMNLYTSEDNSLIFEFGLPGFKEADLVIDFEDDYMIFSSTLCNKYSTGGNNRYFKRKLKLKDIKNQKYYVPEDQFDRDDYTLNFEDGLLRIIFKSLEEE